jgi:hypothetical protein
MKITFMNNTIQLSSDRVRKHTSDAVNQKIDQQTQENIQRFSGQGPATISTRLDELKKEWDVERSLELATSINALIGLTLGLTVNKKWHILTAVTAAFMIQHVVQGWCPPLSVFRWFGVRTKEEINSEREALLQNMNGQLVNS